MVCQRAGPEPTAAASTSIFYREELTGGCEGGGASSSETAESKTPALRGPVGWTQQSTGSLLLGHNYKDIFIQRKIGLQDGLVCTMMFQNTDWKS